MSAQIIQLNEENTYIKWVKGEPPPIQTGWGLVLNDVKANITPSLPLDLKPKLPCTF